jgi:hypothetical protein
MPLLGVIANQCHQVSSSTTDVENILLGHCERLNEGLAADTPNRMVARIRSAHKRLAMLQEYEDTLITSVESTLSSEQFLHRVPKIQGEVHDLQALHRVGEYLFISTEPV